jgi:thioredoxin 1
MTIIKVGTAEEFIDLIRDGLCVIDYVAQWCGPCKKIEPMIVNLAEQYPEVKFLKVDVEELSTVCGGVETLPTFIFIKDGKQVSDLMVTGTKMDLLRQNLARFTGQTEAVPAPPSILPTLPLRAAVATSRLAMKPARSALPRRRVYE